MLSTKLCFKKLFIETMLALSLTFILSACDPVPEGGKDRVSAVKSQDAKSQAITKAVITSDCLPPTGSAMEDGEVHICYYDTNSLEQAYKVVAKENTVSNEDSGYGLLQKSLPNKELEDKFDDKETWIKYTWPDKEHVTVIIQMAGGEDNIKLSKEKNRVKVVTTLSAD